MDKKKKSIITFVGILVSVMLIVGASIFVVFVPFSKTSDVGTSPPPNPEFSKILYSKTHNSLFIGQVYGDIGQIGEHYKSGLGLVIYNFTNNTWTTKTDSDGLIRDMIIEMVIDDDILHIGTLEKGVYVYNISSGSVYNISGTEGKVRRIVPTKDPNRTYVFFRGPDPTMGTYKFGYYNLSTTRFNEIKLETPNGEMFYPWWPVGYDDAENIIYIFGYTYNENESERYIIKLDTSSNSIKAFKKVSEPGVSIQTPLYLKEKKKIYVTTFPLSGPSELMEYDISNFSNTGVITYRSIVQFDGYTNDIGVDVNESTIFILSTKSPSLYKISLLDYSVTKVTAVTPIGYCIAMSVDDFEDRLFVARGWDGFKKTSGIYIYNYKNDTLQSLS